MRYYELCETAPVERTAVGTKRFLKDFESYRRKYPALIKNLQDFIAFRQGARPDQPYGTKDAPMTDVGGWRRYHLIHGKAILLYNITNTEVQLGAIVEHNEIEGGKQAHYAIRRYLLGLSDDDFTPVAAAPQAAEQALQPAQIEEVKNILYDFATSDRATLMQAAQGEFDVIFEYTRLLVEDDWSDEAKDQAVLAAFGGPQGFATAIRDILRNTAVKEGRRRPMPVAQPRVQESLAESIIAGCRSLYEPRRST